VSDTAFHIDPVACRAAHDSIASAINKLTSLLADVESQGRVLLDSWEGEAQEAYYTRQQQWHADADTIKQKLQQINRGLDEAIQIYVQADRAGARLITSA
jgi:WXG100 family type VII secretion target